ncbi:MAG: helix-turn-helix domain-containing protein [Acidobacteria bacterium]|nr:helix-turn-helix domain-containing protein [Acidobacteriota bacterium]
MDMKLLTVNEVAGVLRCTYQSVYRHYYAGYFPEDIAFQIKGRILFYEDKLEDFLRDQHKNMNRRKKREAKVKTNLRERGEEL